MKLPWEEAGWLEEATGWIEKQLADAGWRSMGPVEIVHQRPWSTFLRVATDKGTAHFKAPAPYDKYEAALTEALARRRPDITVPLLAVDLDRGWLLSADAGITLRNADPTAGQVAHWLKVVPINAELQQQMADQVPQLLALGMIDRRLARLPGLYAALMENQETLRVGLADGLTAAEYQALLAYRPRIAEMCQELAGYDLPETLTHEEVHDANILVNDEGYVFTDWSDSSVSHPFFSMVVTLRAAAYRLELAEDGPEMKRVLETYLEAWTGRETRARLTAAFDLAYRLGAINRALSWQQGTGSLAKRHKEPYADAVPAWLQYFLEISLPGG
jgi:hypothetical protein